MSLFRGRTRIIQGNVFSISNGVRSEGIGSNHNLLGKNYASWPYVTIAGMLL